MVCIDGGSSAINLPTGYIGYDFDIPNDFSGSTSALDLYLHALEINGTIYFYPPAVTNPTTPVLTSGNQLVIQSFINSCLVSEGFSANDLIFIVNGDNTITIWTSPTYLIAGSEFWMGTSSSDNYTNKYFPTIPTTHSYPVSKIQAQLVKQKTSTGEIVDKFYTIGLNPTEVILTGDEIITSGSCNYNKQRIHENFVITGTTPLTIPDGAISISVTKTNASGIVNISGDNGIAFPLTFNRENFTDSVNESISTLSAYTITGTLAGTTYKVHIIR